MQQNAAFHCLPGLKIGFFDHLDPCNQQIYSGNDVETNA